MLSAVRKLRGRSSDELRVRATQALSALRERLSGPVDVGSDGGRLLASAIAPAAVGGARDPAALLAAFRARPAAGFFAPFQDRQGTVETVRARWPDAELATVGRADRAIAGRFDVLGHCDLTYGTPIDWHLDPIAGKRAPLVHWSRVPYLDPSVVGDHKVVWELNRHQHFVTFGQAFWLTGDPRYAAAFTEQLAAWMDANPLKLGMNWASSLEVAVRAISWVWALHFLRDAPELEPALYGRALAYLHASARHLEQYLSTYFSPNTHLTGEALGLLYIGSCFPEFRAAGRWRRAGWSVLTAQLDKQVRADGVYFEQASYYHRYTTEFYLHAVALREMSGGDVAPAVHAKLTQLLDHLEALLRPDGRLPLIGDDDGGRLVMLTARDPADARATLAVGALRYARADWAAAAAGASEELGWMVGGAEVRRFDALAARAHGAESRAFPAGGYFVMRSGEGDRQSYLLIDCGPHGTMNCGHAHADVLGIELVVDGRPLLVDSGTYTYPGADRNLFREGAAHNTTTLDGESSSVPGTPFTWRTVATASPERWAAEPRFAYFVGRHDGFRRLPAPATVGRTVVQIAGWGWIVADRVDSAASHTLRIHHHAAPRVAIEPDPHGLALRPNAVAGGGPARPVRLLALPPAGAGDPGRFTVDEGWVSPLYGARERAATAVYETATRPGTHEVVTFVLPDPAGGNGRWEAVERGAHRGRIFALTVLGRGAAVVLRGGGGAGVQAEAVETDAEWLWVSPTLAAPDEFVLIDGSFLTIGGEQVVGLAESASWVVGERDASGWRLRHGRVDRLSGE